MDSEKEIKYSDILKPEESADKDEGISILGAYKEMLLNTGEFFIKYVDVRKPAHIVFFIAAFLINFGVGRVDRFYIKAGEQLTANLSFLNTWPAYFAAVAVSSLTFGAFSFLLSAAFYYLRVKWSKGTPDFSKSAKLAVYTAAVPALAAIVLTAGTFVFFRDPYASVSVSAPLFDNGVFFISVLSVYVSIVISYKAVRAITDAQHSKSRFWFLIFPFFLATVFFGALFYISNMR